MAQQLTGQTNMQHSLAEFFKGYRQAFESYQLATLSAFYTLPTTLQSGEQIVQLDNQIQFNTEFCDIFTVLKHGAVAKLNAENASYCKITDEIVLVVIDWQFYDTNNALFTDFSASYHLVLTGDSFKIFNTVSHPLSNSVTLTAQLNCEQINR